MSAILSISGEKEIPILGACTIGRSETNMVVIDHSKVSRRHAVIQELSVNDYWLFDFDTVNGTTVNGKRIERPVALQNADEIGIGEEVLTFRQLDTPIGPNVPAADSLQQTTEGELPVEPILEPNFYEPKGHGMIALDEDLSITAITEPARQWLDKFYPDDVRSTQLPKELKNWAEARANFLRGREIAAPPPTVFIKERENERLLIRMQQELRAGGYMLLVTMQGPLFTIETLTEDFGRDFAITPRQAEVLYWLAWGKSNPNIAAILEIALGTVIKHLENSYPKIEVANRFEALRFIEDYHRQKRDD